MTQLLANIRVEQRGLLKMRFSAWAIGLGFVVIPTALLMAAPQPAPRAGRSAPAKPEAHPGYQVLARSCFQCHGQGTRLSDLDLRSVAAARQGGKHGAALVPGDASASRLYQMVAGLAKPQMPPTGALSGRDVRLVKAWIDAGAPYPGDVAAADERWWAFRSVKRPALPEIPGAALRGSGREWVKHPVDRFLLAKMSNAGIRPSAPADRRTLIRRATFDLHGLPPTPEEVDAFVADRSPDAWERVVDRLLASPRYGERMARHWLDLARYAESNGFKADETRPTAWHYRDYVIRSFNEDRPYDRFIREQLAGDELDPRNPEALIATAFNRHWADESNAKNIPLRRQEILNDMTDTTGSVFLGLTVGCARCHDHKYDPLTHRDYYSLQAFFAASQPRDDLPLVPAEQVNQYGEQLARWESETRDLRARMATLEAPYRAKVLKEKRAFLTDDVQDAIDTPPAKRTALQWQLFLKVEPQITVKDGEVGKAMKGEDRTRWEAMSAELEQFDSLKPAPLPTTMGITDVGAEAPKVHVLAVGVYDRPEAEVGPAFPAAVDARPPGIRRPDGMSSTGRRAALAEWIASPDNPLTARVMVNRAWQMHFGRGLVPTANDFGRAGEPVSHPEMLDWLAAELVAQGWSLKAMHRLLLTSAAYRQSSANDPAMAAKDPDNRLLWRYRRWRLEGEALRDSCLSVSGTLNLKMHGPSVFPELPEGVSTRGGWPVTRDEAERNRRSVYVFVRRNLRYPLFEAFDFPDTHEPCARRSVTNTAPQALMLFNSELALKPAQAMAGRLLREAETAEARVERAYQLAFGRSPETAEREGALRFLRDQGDFLRLQATRGGPIKLPTGATAADAVEGAALVDFCHALMNANEFLFVD